MVARGYARSNASWLARRQAVQNTPARHSQSLAPPLLCIETIAIGETLNPRPLQLHTHTYAHTLAFSRVPTCSSYYFTRALDDLKNLSLPLHILPLSLLLGSTRLTIPSPIRSSYPSAAILHFLSSFLPTILVNQSRTTPPWILERPPPSFPSGKRVDPFPLGRWIILSIQVYTIQVDLYRSTHLPPTHTTLFTTTHPYHYIQPQTSTITTMASRFVENLEEVPNSHPHLNVSLDDILAEERRKRSSSQSSGSSEPRRSGSTSAAMMPTSPTTESKIKRAFTIGGKKGRRSS